MNESKCNLLPLIIIVRYQPLNDHHHHHQHPYHHHYQLPYHLHYHPYQHPYYHHHYQHPHYYHLNSHHFCINLHHRYNFHYNFHNLYLHPLLHLHLHPHLHHLHHHLDDHHQPHSHQTNHHHQHLHPHKHHHIPNHHQSHPQHIQHPHQYNQHHLPHHHQSHPQHIQHPHQYNQHHLPHHHQPHHQFDIESNKYKSLENRMIGKEKILGREDNIQQNRQRRERKTSEIHSRDEKDSFKRVISPFTNGLSIFLLLFLFVTSSSSSSSSSASSLSSSSSFYNSSLSASSLSLSYFFLSASSSASHRKPREAVPCPTDCFCNQQNSMVHCSRKGLKFIPTRIEPITRQLNLNNNHFSNHFLHPLNFTNLSFLEHLYLDDCALEYIHPHTFSSLFSLTHLDLSNNRLRKLLPSTFNHLNLQHLFLNGNRQLELTSEVFLGMTTAGLYLHDCSLKTLDSRLFEPLLSGQAKLKILWLNGNEISRFSPELQSVFTQLTYLKINANPLHCSCETAWLKEFYDSKANSLFKDSLQPTCLTPLAYKNKSLSDFTLAHLKCRSPTFLNHQAVFSEKGAEFKCIATGNPLPSLTWYDQFNRQISQVIPLEDDAKSVKADLKILLKGCLGSENPEDEEGQSSIICSKSQNGGFGGAVSSGELEGMFQCLAVNNLGNVSLKVNVSWPKINQISSGNLKRFNEQTKKEYQNGDEKGVLESLDFDDFAEEGGPNYKKDNLTHISKYTHKHERMYSVLEMLLAVMLTFILTAFLAVAFAMVYWCKFLKPHQKKYQQKSLPPHPFMLPSPQQINSRQPSPFGSNFAGPHSTTTASHTTIQPLITPLEASSTCGSHLYAETSSSLFPMHSASDQHSSQHNFQSSQPNLPPNHPLLSQKSLFFPTNNLEPQKQPRVIHNNPQNLTKNLSNLPENHSILSRNNLNILKLSHNATQKNPQSFQIPPQTHLNPRSTWVTTHGTTAYPPSIICDPRQYQIQRSNSGHRGCFTHKINRKEKHCVFDTGDGGRNEDGGCSDGGKGDGERRDGEMVGLKGEIKKIKTKDKKKRTGFSRKDAKKAVNGDEERNGVIEAAQVDKLSKQESKNNKAFKSSNLSSSRSTSSSSSSSSSSSPSFQQQQLQQLQQHQQQTQQLLIKQLIQQQQQQKQESLFKEPNLENVFYEVIENEISNRIDRPNNINHSEYNNDVTHYPDLTNHTDGTNHINHIDHNNHTKHFDRNKLTNHIGHTNHTSHFDYKNPTTDHINDNIHNHTNHHTNHNHHINSPQDQESDKIYI